MKKILILLVVVLITSPILLKSQIISNESAVISDTVIFTKRQMACFSDRMVISSNNDKLYILNNKNDKKGKLSILCFNTKTYDTSDLKLYFDKKDEMLNNLSRYPIEDFFVKDSVIFLAMFKNLILFNKTSDKEFTYKERVDIGKYNYRSFHMKQIKDEKFLFIIWS